MDNGALIAGIVIGMIVGGCIAWLAASLIHHLDKKNIRAAAVKQSRHVLKGKMAEQMAPILNGFPYNPADARFLGDPIDYIVFDGYAGTKDDQQSADELTIVLMDIKSGGAQLSSAQRKLRDAVAAGRVRFETMRVRDDGSVEIRRG